MALAKTEKEVIVNAVQSLPEDASFEEANGAFVSFVKGGKRITTSR